MPKFTLADVKLPDFGLPSSRPELSMRTYRDRLDTFTKRLIHIGIDAAVIYADREHAANIAYLTGFEPRFEEALLVIGLHREPLIITGPEKSRLCFELSAATRGLALSTLWPAGSG